MHVLVCIIVVGILHQAPFSGSVHIPPESAAGEGNLVSTKGSLRDMPATSLSNSQQVGLGIPLKSSPPNPLSGVINSSPSAMKSFLETSSILDAIPPNSLDPFPANNLDTLQGNSVDPIQGNELYLIQENSLDPIQGNSLVPIQGDALNVIQENKLVQIQENNRDLVQGNNLDPLNKINPSIQFPDTIASVSPNEVVLDVTPGVSPPLTPIASTINTEIPIELLPVVSNSKIEVPVQTVPDVETPIFTQSATTEQISPTENLETTHKEPKGEAFRSFSATVESPIIPKGDLVSDKVNSLSSKFQINSNLPPVSSDIPGMPFIAAAKEINSNVEALSGIPEFRENTLRSLGTSLQQQQQQQHDALENIVKALRRVVHGDQPQEKAIASFVATNELPDAVKKPKTKDADQSQSIGKTETIRSFIKASKSSLKDILSRKDRQPTLRKGAKKSLQDRINELGKRFKLSDNKNETSAFHHFGRSLNVGHWGQRFQGQNNGQAFSGPGNFNNMNNNNNNNNNMNANNNGLPFNNNNPYNFLAAMNFWWSQQQQQNQNNQQQFGSNNQQQFGSNNQQQFGSNNQQQSGPNNQQQFNPNGPSFGPGFPFNGNGPQPFIGPGNVPNGQNLNSFGQGFGPNGPLNGPGFGPNGPQNGPGFGPNGPQNGPGFIPNGPNIGPGFGPSGFPNGPLGFGPNGPTSGPGFGPNSQNNGQGFGPNGPTNTPGINQGNAGQIPNEWKNNIFDPVTNKQVGNIGGTPPVPTTKTKPLTPLKGVKSVHPPKQKRNEKKNNLKQASKSDQGIQTDNAPAADAMNIMRLLSFLAESRKQMKARNTNKNVPGDFRGRETFNPGVDRSGLRSRSSNQGSSAGLSKWIKQQKNKLDNMEPHNNRGSLTEDMLLNRFTDVPRGFRDRIDGFERNQGGLRIERKLIKQRKKTFHDAFTPMLDRMSTPDIVRLFSAVAGDSFHDIMPAVAPRYYLEFLEEELALLRSRLNTKSTSNGGQFRDRLPHRITSNNGNQLGDRFTERGTHTHRNQLGEKFPKIDKLITGNQLGERLPNRDRLINENQLGNRFTERGTRTHRNQQGEKFPKIDTLLTVNQLGEQLPNRDTLINGNQLGERSPKRDTPYREDKLGELIMNIVRSNKRNQQNELFPSSSTSNMRNRAISNNINHQNEFLKNRLASRTGFEPRHTRTNPFNQNQIREVFPPRITPDTLNLSALLGGQGSQSADPAPPTLNDIFQQNSDVPLDMSDPLTQERVDRVLLEILLLSRNIHSAVVP